MEDQPKDIHRLPIILHCIKRYLFYYKSYNNKHNEIFQLILPEYANIMVCAHISQQIYTCSIIGQRINILHEHEDP